MLQDCNNQSGMTPFQNILIQMLLHLYPRYGSDYGYISKVPKDKDDTLVKQQLEESVNIICFTYSSLVLLGHQEKLFIQSGNFSQLKFQIFIAKMNCMFLSEGCYITICLFISARRHNNQILHLFRNACFHFPL